MPKAYAKKPRKKSGTGKATAGMHRMPGGMMMSDKEMDAMMGGAYKAKPKVAGMPMTAMRNAKAKARKRAK